MQKSFFREMLLVRIFLIIFFVISACQQTDRKSEKTEDSNIQKSQEVRSSLLGLGPYPDVSDEVLEMLYFETVDDLWDKIESRVKEDEEWGLIHELMIRVRIKLWEQGIITRGAFATGNGWDIVVYPSIFNVAYVEWGFKEGPNGKSQRYAVRKKGPNIHKVSHYFDSGEVPPGWTVKSFEEGAIDPYKFLNLNKRK